MNLRVRLGRLERSTALLPERADPDACPPGWEPEAWASRLRISDCLGERINGTLARDAYVPNTTAEERDYVDGLQRVFEELELYEQQREG